jgi:hypothetical protein
VHSWNPGMHVHSWQSNTCTSIAAQFEQLHQHRQPLLQGWPVQGWHSPGAVVLLVTLNTATIFTPCAFRPFTRARYF